jgi:ribosomal protein S27E
LVAQHYPAFCELRAESGRPLPGHVQEEFEAYRKCGRLEHGFLRVRCERCHAEKLVAFSCKKRGFCPSCGARRMAETAALLADKVLPERPLRQWVLSLPHALRFLLATNPAALTLVLGTAYRTISDSLLRRAELTRTTGHAGAVTLVQRFGSALNLNIHFHMLFLDGVYRTEGVAAPVFRQVPEPGAKDLQGLVEQIALRIGRTLEQRGLIERDIENAWLAADAEAGPLDDLIGHSITYRIAVGPRAGQKLFTLQTVPPRLQGLEGDANGAARAGGFSLHAGVAIAAGERARLERLCRYVSRPPVPM